MLHSNIIKRTIAGVIAITGVVVFTFVLVHSAISESPEIFINPQTIANNLPVGKVTYVKAVDGVKSKYPSRIIIPSIKVDAAIDDVGIARSGNMAVPINYVDVGWYRNGPLPGENGTAIIDGHVDNGLGLSAVFGKLSQLQPGDKIIIRFKNDTEKKFIVTESRVYDYSDPTAAAKIFEQEDTPTLRLITCQGTWDQSEKMYDKRLVVTAQLIP